MAELKSKPRETMDPGLQERIISYINDREKSSLSEFASKSEEGIRRGKKEHKKDDIRTKYSRDSDRIMHTYAYARYIDKTQVFFLVDNDHITHRVLHVQLVSRIARTIGRALRLNEDLIEAISIGHDIGHVPFGHIGEDILSETCKKNGIGRFLHNIQGIQFLDKIEACDLTLQVLDGILCHNGEIHDQVLKPDRDKGWERFDSQIKAIKNGEQKYAPMTLEGCVVRFADTIAYLGRDIQDAIEVNLINEGLDIPDYCKENIGVKNREIINSLIIDLIENSYEKDYISYSDKISKAVEIYKNFNKDIIYQNPKILAEKEKIKNMYLLLFKNFLVDIEKENKNSKIYEDFFDVDWIKSNENYFETSNNAEIVRDYMAGMTDRYFENRFKEFTNIKRVLKFS
jgi:dGTPase